MPGYIALISSGKVAGRSWQARREPLVSASRVQASPRSGVGTPPHRQGDKSEGAEGVRARGVALLY